MSIVSASTFGDTSFGNKHPRPRSSFYSQATLDEEDISPILAGQAFGMGSQQHIELCASQSLINGFSSSPAHGNCRKWSGWTTEALSKSQDLIAEHKPRWLEVSQTLQDDESEKVIGNPYEQNWRNPSPIQIKTLPANKHLSSKHGTTSLALIKGLGQQYAARHIQPYVLKTHQNADGSSRSNHSSFGNDTFTSVSYTSRSASLSKSHRHCLSPKILAPETRDPTRCSNQGIWLETGTLRGPAPSSMKLIDNTLSESLNKRGNMEKGIKEIRKILKHENRMFIEWVEMYLRRKWCVEL